MDPVSSCSFPTSGSSDNPARKQSTDLDVQTGCPQSEDTDAFESGIQLTSAGFDPAQPSAIHTYVSDFTHPLTVKSLQQLDSQFGCILLGEYKLYTGPPFVWHSVPYIIQAHNLIRTSGVPNLGGQRIPVKSDLNISSWRQHLCDYFDQQLVDLIQYGFPLDFDRILDLFSTLTTMLRLWSLQHMLINILRKNYPMVLS